MENMKKLKLNLTQKEAYELEKSVGGRFTGGLHPFESETLFPVFQKLYNYRAENEKAMAKKAEKEKKYEDITVEATSA